MNSQLESKFDIAWHHNRQARQAKLLTQRGYNSRELPHHHTAFLCVLEVHVSLSDFELKNVSENYYDRVRSYTLSIYVKAIPK